MKPLYMLPIFKNKNFNFYSNNKNDYNYSASCPVVEDLYYEKFIGHEFMRPIMSKNDLDDVIEAFIKLIRI